MQFRKYSSHTHPFNFKFLSDILPIKTMNKFFNVVEILSHGPNQTSHHMRNKVIQY